MDTTPMRTASARRPHAPKPAESRRGMSKNEMDAVKREVVELDELYREIQKWIAQVKAQLERNIELIENGHSPERFDTSHFPFEVQTLTYNYETGMVTPDASAHGNTNAHSYMELGYGAQKADAICGTFYNIEVPARPRALEDDQKARAFVIAGQQAQAEAILYYLNREAMKRRIDVYQDSMMNQVLESASSPLTAKEAAMFIGKGAHMTEAERAEDARKETALAETVVASVLLRIADYLPRMGETSLSDEKLDRQGMDMVYRVGYRDRNGRKQWARVGVDVMNVGTSTGGSERNWKKELKAQERGRYLKEIDFGTTANVDGIDVANMVADWEQQQSETAPDKYMTVEEATRIAWSAMKNVQIYGQTPFTREEVGFACQKAYGGVQRKRAA